MEFDKSQLLGSGVILEVADEDSGPGDTFQGAPNFYIFVNGDSLSSSRDGNQVSGSFALSWAGNSFHSAVTTEAVFTVQQGGSGSDKYMATSALRFKELLTQYIFKSVPDQISVVRSSTSPHSVGYSYAVIFSSESMDGNVPLLTYLPSPFSTLHGKDASVTTSEMSTGAEIIGSFQLRFMGETTRPLMHDASALDVQNALNELSSIAPSKVTVKRSTGPKMVAEGGIRDGLTRQVGQYTWLVTFASNVWKDPTKYHGPEFAPGNWVGPAVSATSTWDSGFSKAWGKNVGDVPMIQCLDSGLSTTNGFFPRNGCAVSELVKGTAPLGGSFKLQRTGDKSNNGSNKSCL
jgi:hypothetical protein